ncbi:tRNA(Ile)-lysidine synthase [Sphaerotilus hippei]|uniref:tRNA(Ile)-lysidine synthase n=2 Tax=Sphaerotilus hippei TaxID=744406 RepID=A0A318H4T8_9BURK|nr:tRNA(Ile)-lysidine synthase [Sphaerotilus hippei]
MPMTDPDDAWSVLPHALDLALGEGEGDACGRLAVACSGGRDSMALLHAATCWARPRGIEVHALHVHHGLSPHADEWAEVVAACCADLRAAGAVVVHHVRRLALRPARGESVEAMARSARYQALTRMALESACSTVLLAHHRDDQAETFLLQALRGAGVAGLAAMPASAHRGGLRWLRPWLARPRAAIEAYVGRHHLCPVDDDSNTDLRLARNRLRLQVMPVLREAFAQAPAVLGETVSRLQDARVCLEALAGIDLDRVRVDAGLATPALLVLGPSRARNALLHWLRDELGVAVSTRLLQRLAEELAHAPEGRWSVGEAGWLHHHRGVLAWRPGPVDPVPAGTGGAEDRPEALALQITGLGEHAVPAWAGVLSVCPVAEGEPGLVLCPGEVLTLKPRAGGEQFQRAPQTPPRALKKQFQFLAVPVWARGGPLVWRGAQLLWVPGLGLDARCHAPPGAASVVTLAWHSVTNG